MQVKGKKKEGGEGDQVSGPTTALLNFIKGMIVCINFCKRIVFSKISFPKLINEVY